MPLDRNLLFQRVNAIDYGLAYAFGVLANLAYYPDQNFDDAWAAAFGFTDSQTVVTPGAILPNYTRVRGDGACMFGIAGTTHYLQMADNIIYSGQVSDSAFGAGQIHSYFRWCANGLIPLINADLAGRTPGQTKLAFTGHSLGGAIAHLLSWYYALQGWDVRNCVMFNSPKAGDSDFARLSRPFGFWHIVNAYDKVSGLPPTNLRNRLILALSLLGDYNSWEHAQPMIEVTVSESVNTISPNTPPARAGVILPFLDRLSEHMHNRLYESAKDRAARETAARTATKWGGTALCVTALIALNLNNHRLERLLEEILNLYRGVSGPLNLNDITDLQAHLDRQPVELQEATAYPRDFALVDPGPFMSATPPSSPAVTPTPTPSGSTIESTVFSGTSLTLGRSQPVPTTLRMDEVVIPPGATPPVWIERPRRHWFHRGQDRRMLLSLEKLMDAIERRDDVALSSETTSTISNRDTVIDWDDPDQVEAWYTLRAHVASLLALAHDV